MKEKTVSHCEFISKLRPFKLMEKYTRVREWFNSLTPNTAMAMAPLTHPLCTGERLTVPGALCWFCPPVAATYLNCPPIPLFSSLGLSSAQHRYSLHRPHFIL